MNKGESKRVMGKKKVRKGHREHRANGGVKQYRANRGVKGYEKCQVGRKGDDSSGES